MNKIILLILGLFSIQAIAQQRDKSEILYDRGNAAVTRKDYRTADSLFTLSLNLVPHPDSYFNRAVCRRQLNNFKGYCLDLKSATELGDNESSKLYFKQCVKSDTIFKKSNNEPAVKTDFDFVELVTSYKYNSDFDFRKYDTSGNINLSRLRVDNISYYRNCLEVKEALYKGDIDSLVNYIKNETTFLKYVKKNDLFEIAYISLLIDENGKVSKVQSNSGFKLKVDAELENIFTTMPNWNPAIYNNKAVKFMHDLSVKYYDNVFEINRVENKLKNIPGIFSVVEIMPEFPGGISEMMKYLGRSVVYPRNAREAGISGKCFLKFVVNSDGTISDVAVEKGVSKCKECDAEAVRVIKLMPTWKPGTQNGKPVSCFYSLPISFQLR
jgi:TonB family protein